MFGKKMWYKHILFEDALPSLEETCNLSMALWKIVQRLECLNILAQDFLTEEIPVSPCTFVM